MTSFLQKLPVSDQLTLFGGGAAQGEYAAWRKAPQSESSNAEAGLSGLNSALLHGLTVVRPYDIAQIQPCLQVPAKLVAFSEAVSRNDVNQASWVHFYEDDSKFDRLWSNPTKYFARLREYQGLISPDFSIYRNMPSAMKIWNTYRNYLLGARWQADGLNVIANIRLSGENSIPYALAGAPRRSVIALGLHGCTRNRDNRVHVRREVQVLLEELQPAGVVLYGSAAYGILEEASERDVPVYVFKPDSWRRSSARSEDAA